MTPHNIPNSPPDPCPVCNYPAVSGYHSLTCPASVPTIRRHIPPGTGITNHQVRIILGSIASALISQDLRYTRNGPAVRMKDTPVRKTVKRSGKAAPAVPISRKAV